MESDDAWFAENIGAIEEVEEQHDRHFVFNDADMVAKKDKWNRTSYVKPFTCSLYARRDFAGDMEIKMNRRCRTIYNVGFFSLRFIILPVKHLQIYYYVKLKDIIIKRIWALFTAKYEGDISVLQSIVEGLKTKTVDIKILYFHFSRNGNTRVVKPHAYYSLRDYNRFVSIQHDRVVARQEEARNIVKIKKRKEYKESAREVKKRKMEEDTRKSHRVSVFVPRSVTLNKTPSEVSLKTVFLRLKNI
ncbi:hypothetical protein SLEP1_g60537 [Rubroshorea leprosula]|uniref:Uncharacterized protein n=1 Tax=Rubroshorea leprosula TaxID=152421 RepID=A0AAV5MZQ1_9ROSI|nr:hypothetical protein SLEP1_g60537 [Rubroshorea leprosula]